MKDILILAVFQTEYDWNSIVSKLTHNPWVLLISFIFTIMSVILAVIFFFKSIKRKQPVYRIRSRNLFELDDSNSIKVTYENKDVKSLTISKIVFWNRGKETINNSDIASAEPILVSLTDGFEILDVQLIKSSKNSNRVEIKKISNNISNIQFEYLDKDEGFIVQIIHNGLSSDDVIVSGIIKGFGQIYNYNSNSQSLKIVTKILDIYSRYLIRHPKIMSVFLVGMPIIVYTIVVINQGLSRIRLTNSIYSLMLTLVYFWTAFLMQKKILPKELQVFNEDFEDIA